MKQMFIAALLLLGQTVAAQTPASGVPRLAYPATRQVDTVDTYFGTRVPDPYRWLEHNQTADTKAWVQAENQVTQDYLNKIPYRAAIHQRLTSVLNYEKYSAPHREGQYTYYSKNTGLQNQSVLYRQRGQGAPEVFLDPNTFSKDGTTRLAGLSFSRDGSLVAYQLSENGSDWRKVCVRRTADKRLVGDTLRNVQFSDIAWRGNDGFYYSGAPEPAPDVRFVAKTAPGVLYFHQLGTSQARDQVVFKGAQRPYNSCSGLVTEDGRYLVISAGEDVEQGNQLYVQDLRRPGSPLLTIQAEAKRETSLVDNVGSTLYLLTNDHAPNYRLVSADAATPQPAHWRTVIAERPQVLSVSAVGGKLFASYLQDATTHVEQYSHAGRRERSIPLPGLGSTYGFWGKQTDRVAYYTFTSYVYPFTIFKYDVASGKSTVFKQPKLQFDPSKYESMQVFYTSKDGTRVPMLITHKRGLVLNGKNPTLLYAYGGFNISITPFFNPANIILLEQGGVYAVPNLRGGGEYGEKWHLAGTKLQRQNVFDDYIAAAEYLIKNNYTSKDYLALDGASAGGLLVGATMAQRPDLFKVAFPAVGVMDMLRYQRFTVGASWASDYGTAQDSPEMFNYLYKYSPYHALKPASYPATPVTTADHDDRVVPAHSFKFAARLQEDQQGPAPVLIQVATKAGHGTSSTLAQYIDAQADKWAFFFENLGLPYAVPAAALPTRASR